VGIRAGLDAVAKRKKSRHRLCREVNSGRPACSLVSILTGLSFTAISDFVKIYQLILKLKGETDTQSTVSSYIIHFPKSYQFRGCQYERNMANISKVSKVVPMLN